MSHPPVTFADWRAQVDKELAGASFEKVLVQKTLEGLSLDPLYVALPDGALPSFGPGAPFRICLRADDPGKSLTRDVGDDANEATWLPFHGALPAHEGRGFLVLETSDPIGALAALPRDAGFALDADPVARAVRGATGPTGSVTEGLHAVAKAALAMGESHPGGTAVLVSSLAAHEAGADAAFELACALSAGVAHLRAMLLEGLSVEAAAKQIGFQIAVGRETFTELAKLRALRACWDKVLVAAGVAAPPRALVHAVSSRRTLALRDPWVNMLRITTQVFAAILGGADLVTPLPFDEPFEAPSSLGARVARNTGLVLREESFLGKVTDPAAGSYFLETLSGDLARAAWVRFQGLEGDGGVVAAIASGALAKTLETTWSARLDAIAKRKTPLLGVSEFANLGETLPSALPASRGSFGHRDAEPFESLRARAERRSPPLEAVLVTLGPLAESRARVGFANGLFGAGGIPTRETTSDEEAALVCICGSDERYAAEAVERVRALKAAGAGRVLLAGRPGALEAPLREAGIDGFVFAGCDAVAVLSTIVGEESAS